MSRREFSGAAVATSLASGVSDLALVLPLDDFAGWPLGTTAPFVAVIRRSTANEEKVLIQTRSGSELNVLERGYDGTVATQHPPGASVEHTIDAGTMNDIMRHVHDEDTDDHPDLARTVDVPTVGLIVALGG